ncbi:MAG TPA: archaeosortase/exosortase family protein [Actinocrinis sp.]|uniref:archaeosortase/exosortase family protein n=1 Tax=Actinocrinis sp. TaxID=1920516 RepID=UPI002DDD2357|nr:archaeosortase/exosortase family protein [Actinocrinis sp.]HEV2344306.1 archaeosortase/exosortase family protein [Actinocrinis sp.]
MSIPQESGEAAVDAASPARPGGVRRLTRYAAAFGGVAAAITLLLSEHWYRGVEAVVTGDTVSKWLGFPVIVSRAQQTMFFAFRGTGPSHMLGLQITLGCSSVLLLAPILLLTGVLLSLRNVSPLRVLFAAAIAGSLVVFINVVRLVMIAAMVDWWGVAAGFGWGHTLFGSVLMLLGLAAALGSFVLVLGYRGRGRVRAT